MAIAERDPAPGVYVTLDELVRLKYLGRALSLGHRQPRSSKLAGRRASRIRGRGLDFEELRAYQPGDDIRAIDWRVTARIGRPFIRVYREEKERRAMLVVDQRGSMFFGSVRDMKSVTAVRAAALAAFRIVAGGDRVGALVFDDDECRELRPQRSVSHVMRLLGVLRDFNHRLDAGAPSRSDADALDRALLRLLRSTTHDQLIILVSDLAGAGESTRELMAELRRKNDVVVVWVSDPLEAELPDVGMVALSDGALQIQVDTGDRGLRSAFSARHRARQENVTGHGQRYDIPVLPLSTADDAVTQLEKLFGRRAAGRRG